ncbi:MAG: sigma-70 family RNA polymerase sigma factor [Ideonella sp.]
MMVQTDRSVRRHPRPNSTPTVLAQASGSPVQRFDEASEVKPQSAADNECDQLLLATAASDRSAFGRLYRLTSARLFATVRRSIWIQSEAEEVLQEVYLKIWSAAAAYDPTQSRSMTWMTRVARNHSIDHLRRCAARRANEVTVDADRHIDEGASFNRDLTPIDDSPRPDEWLQMQQDQRRFDQLIDGLGKMQRQVLVLAFRDGYTQADIALRLDAPLGSVKSWMRRALQSLKSSIDTRVPCDA